MSRRNDLNAMRLEAHPLSILLCRFFPEQEWRFVFISVSYGAAGA